MRKRKKIRFRWPHAQYFTGIGKLEIKHKEERVGWKELYEVSAPAEETSNWPRFTEYLTTMYPYCFSYKSPDAYRPVLQTRFLRRYMVSTDGRLRATLDTELEVFNQAFYQRQAFDDRVEFTGKCILELKFDSDYFDVISQRIGSIVSRSVQCSKYVSGVQRLFYRDE